MTAVLAQLSDPTVLVALITGVTTAAATITASAVTGGRAVRAERERARHALDVERARWERDARERGAESFAQRVDDVRSTVLRFNVTARWILHVRTAGPSGEDRGELAGLLERLPDEVFAALTAVERLRTALPEGHRGLAAELARTVEAVSTHVISREHAAPDRLGDGPEVMLRRLLDAVSPPPRSVPERGAGE
ncbi:hypothetical protein SAMN05421803_12376 [Nocardiopsis flavescens]|uniref:Uncharacterized protein n=1 Tax=Nocardiopsis flavescens TaxID=758803 RepID=A0A1M6THC3_9ACTN|nr:hypothetical protein [Nocardiopsis flavescens]SHK56340.1 hypothetical protein SAMN05421803_12376 [Nocardiopsis flavescens]